MEIKTNYFPILITNFFTTTSKSSLVEETKSLFRNNIELQIPKRNSNLASISILLTQLLPWWGSNITSANTT